MKTKIETLNVSESSFKSKRSNDVNFGARLMVNLQKIGKALLYPIAVLPFAALLNRFGALATGYSHFGTTGEYDVLYWIGLIIGTPGAIVFNNIALIFAIGVGFGLSKDNRGESALVAAVLFLAITTYLKENGIQDLFYKNVLPFTYNDDKGVAHSASQLFYVPSYSVKPDGSTFVSGQTFILDIGVLGGIVSGGVTAMLYNKYSTIKLPQTLSFFGGRRFIPMLALSVSLPLALAFAIIWPWLQFILIKFGTLISSSDAWAIPGAMLYALVNRAVQPFGIHHIINTFLWFQLPIEGDMINSSGKIGLEGSNFANNLPTSDGLALMKNIAHHWASHPDINSDNWQNYFFNYGSQPKDVHPGKDGSQIVFGDINAFQKGIISGNFQTGYFPMYWGGLPAAALAMIMTAKPENRREVSTFLGGVALVAALTGIDEPIVFAFIFVGPILWAYNAIFTAIFAGIAIAMHMHIGFGFSAGFIDYVISFANSWGMSKWEGNVNGSLYGVLSNPLWMLVLAACIAPVYYFAFYFTIKKFDIKTPGREDMDVAIKPMASKSASLKGDKYVILAENIVDIIGEDNIVKVDNCATRLRLIVKDNSIGTDQEFKALGIFGTKRLGKEGLQLIIGTDVEHVANAMHDITNK
ncbi:PTS transporter subunit EIIC [Spiroplasma endosymbiont of Crioceris asparagi]|uniref:PTS transporter subunit EIIC n=1 Tax=Spiroplasma endosymbiont of Crioceris asparagi TaxID=3066286 RepID=UPI0030CED17A